MLSTMTIKNNVTTNTRLICKYMRGSCLELQDIPGENTGFDTKALANHNMCEKMIYLDKRNKKLIISDITYTIVDERSGRKVFQTVSLDAVEHKMKKLIEDCYSEQIEVVKNKNGLSATKMVKPYNRVDNIRHYEIDVTNSNICVSEYIIYLEGEINVDTYSTKFDSHSDAIIVFGRQSKKETIRERIPDVYKYKHKMLSDVLSGMI